jgi:hypothetical protein
MSRIRLLAAVLSFMSAATLAQDNLNIAKYTATGELQYPANLHQWIQTGASLGGEYNDKPFDPAHPGTFGVVQMEPTAYDYFMQHGSYAEGTMFLLSFYEAQGKSDPQLPGFVQGKMTSQEIHVLDKRFDQGHGFFIFRTPETKTSTVIAAGNPCTVCHLEHGKFNGTFAQFYPAIRAKLGIGE